MINPISEIEIAQIKQDFLHEFTDIMMTAKKKLNAVDYYDFLDQVDNELNDHITEIIM